MLEYRDAIRAFMAEHGRPMVLDPAAKDDWDRVSTYGWTDFKADSHCSEYSKNKCSWVVPEGSVLTEHTYSMFTDTFHDNEDEVGLEVDSVHCACGKYTEVTLRWVGSLGELMRTLVSLPENGSGVKLVL